jgi:hypothetical protein
MKECKWRAAMVSIDREIGIECQDRMTLIDFGHAHDARIPWQVKTRQEGRAPKLGRAGEPSKLI